jgi:PleD family two-component response regulator
VWVPGARTHCRDAATAILRDVAEAFAGDASGLAVGISIGCAPVTSRDDSLPAVLSAADAALYDAKRAGRGRAANAAAGCAAPARP